MKTREKPRFTYHSYTCLVCGKGCATVTEAQKHCRRVLKEERREMVLSGRKNSAELPKLYDLKFKDKRGRPSLKRNHDGSTPKKRKRFSSVNSVNSGSSASSNENKENTTDHEEDEDDEETDEETNIEEEAGLLKIDLKYADVDSGDQQVRVKQSVVKPDKLLPAERGVFGRKKSSTLQLLSKGTVNQATTSVISAKATTNVSTASTSKSLTVRSIDLETDYLSTDLITGFLIIKKKRITASPPTTIPETTTTPTKTPRAAPTSTQTTEVQTPPQEVTIGTQTLPKRHQISKWETFSPRKRSSIQAPQSPSKHSLSSKQPTTTADDGKLLPRTLAYSEKFKKCSECSFRFRNDLLRAHFEEEHGDRSVRCSMTACPVRFANAERMLAHKAAIHTTCASCAIVFLNRTELQQHKSLGCYQQQREVKVVAIMQNPTTAKNSPQFSPDQKESSSARTAHLVVATKSSPNSQSGGPQQKLIQSEQLMTPAQTTSNNSSTSISTHSPSSSSNHHPEHQQPELDQAGDQCYSRSCDPDQNTNIENR